MRFGLCVWCLQGMWDAFERETECVLMLRACCLEWWFGACTHPTIQPPQSACDAVEEATAQKQQFDAQLAKANTDAYGMKAAWDKASGRSMNTIHGH